MNTIIVISSVVLLIVGMSLLFSYVKRHNRKLEYSDWEVGDFIIVSSTSSLYDKLIANKQELASLSAWDNDSIYLEVGDTVYQCDWNIFLHNKSASWRRNYDKAEKIMGTKPGFPRGVKIITNPKESININGTPIELLSEVECQVHLKKAIEEENYEMADLIRKRLENFR